jgi:hypothetical protein
MAFDHGHPLWGDILKKNLTIKGAQTLVKYKEIKHNPQDLLLYLDQLSKVNEQEFKVFTNKQRLAFLINAYNAFTIKLIIDHYPTKSIRKIFLIANPWKEKFIPLFGKKVHLDHIEHDLIRSKFKEPRIHFAVNCASMGCPNLLLEAFTHVNLNELLDKAAQAFLLDPNKNNFRPRKSQLNLSKIFKWYKDDFVKSHGSVVDFISNYMNLSSADVANIKKGKIKTFYTDYSWDLNEEP